MMLQAGALVFRAWVNRFGALGALASLCLITACAFNVEQAYDGTPRPPTEVAEVRTAVGGIAAATGGEAMTAGRMTITVIDARTLEPYTYRVNVLPGEHRVGLVWCVLTGVSGTVSSSGATTFSGSAHRCQNYALRATMRAGHVYEVRSGEPEALVSQAAPLHVVMLDIASLQVVGDSRQPAGEMSSSKPN